MLKASALYIVIVIALVIATLCSSLIVSAYFYRLQYQETFRYDKLQTNLSSAENIVLAGQDTGYSHLKILNLFDGEDDSVSMKKIFWGAFDIGIIKSFIQKDTLYKVFSIANTIDSSKWAALYLADNNRPLSVSGTTLITGNVFIPKTGVNQAAIANQSGPENKNNIIGNKFTSQAELPPLDPVRLLKLQQVMEQNGKNTNTLQLNSDSISCSFLSPTRIINLSNKVTTLENIKLTGNIILFSDTLLNISNSALINNIIIFAKSVNIESGFRGNCQIFAADSISVGPGCTFNYPSCLGILRFDSLSTVKSQAKINLYTGVEFNGLVFTYEQQKTKVPPLVFIGTNAKIKGQVYSPGFIEFQTNAEIDGSVFTGEFLLKTPFTLYQDELNNIIINQRLLSPYYLTSSLMPVSANKKKILQWIASN